MNKRKFIVSRKVNLKFRTAHSLRKNHRLFTRVSMIRKSLTFPSTETTKIKPSLKKTINLKINHMNKDLHTEWKKWNHCSESLMTIDKTLYKMNTTINNRKYQSRSSKNPDFSHKKVCNQFKKPFDHALNIRTPTVTLFSDLLSRVF